jgi:hypothetical protein
MARKPDLYVATSTGAVRVDGKVINYAAGKTLVRLGHPILLALPGRFRPVEGILEAPVKAQAVKPPVVPELDAKPVARFGRGER